jgi:hypothetical protein
MDVYQSPIEPISTTSACHEQNMNQPSNNSSPKPNPKAQ